MTTDTTFTLPADCTREAALTLLAHVREQGPAAVAIDGGSVATIGQAMLQVLLVVLAGRPVANPSAALIDALRNVGLHRQLLEGTGQ